MSIIINTNISSIRAMNAFNTNTNALSKALERLSTGFRINSSKDDAAGSAISSSLGVQISGYEIVQDNAKTGQAMLDTAGGALSNISDMLVRIRTLALQSINGTYSTDERNAMQDEASELVSEIYRVKSSTLFNSRAILGSEEVTRISEQEAIAQGYTVVKTAQQLKDSLRTNDADCKVMLFADINLDDLGVDGTGSNWTAVGTSESNMFKGTLDGNGFIISNLKINRAEGDYQGFFGTTNNATIKNVELENINVMGKDRTGGLVGYSYRSTIENCSSSGDVLGSKQIGGLVGLQTHSTFENCHSSGNVTGSSQTGGFVGYSYDSSIITNCSSSGNVTSVGSYIGGLVGYTNTNIMVENCSSSAVVSGKSYTGGLVGYNYKSTITNCSSSGNVTGSSSDTGGLVGTNTTNSTIENCNSTGNVLGNLQTGGLAGSNNSNSTIDNCSSSGSVTGNQYTGGLVGVNTSGSKIDKCCSTGDVTGNQYTGGFVGNIGSSTIITNNKTTSVVTGNSFTGAFIAYFPGGTVENNEYNSTINEGKRAVGQGLAPTEGQIKDNQELVINESDIASHGPTGDIGYNPSNSSGSGSGSSSGSSDTTVSLQIGIYGDKTSAIDVDTGFNLGNFNINIKTEHGAKIAIDKIDRLLNTVLDKQSELGAAGNKLDSIIEYQLKQIVSIKQTKSLIKDTDYAIESSNYVKSQILQQVTASLLSTANQTPSIALALINQGSRFGIA